MPIFNPSQTAIIIGIAATALTACVIVLFKVFRLTEGLRARTVRDIILNSYDKSSDSVEELRALEIERIRKISAYSREGGGGLRKTLPHRLFRAGLYAPKYRVYFYIIQAVSIVAALCFVPVGFWKLTTSPILTGLGSAAGGMLGFILPHFLLDRRISRREEEVRYYLPLVIEQIAIGVSSALIIATCVKEIIEMADARDAHNPVTELFIHADRLMRNGMSFEEALLDVADVNGTSEIQHAFMFLVQCSRHGGEISKQLQDLGDSTMSERNVQVQGRIAALPVKATGPLGMVFAGFFAVLLSGIIVRIGSAFPAGGMSGM